MTRDSMDAMGFWFWGSIGLDGLGSIAFGIVGLIELRERLNVSREI
jgi:hypothetical protein